jgi:hypothetical protein
MITADPQSELGHWCRIIASLEPGQCLDVDYYELADIASYEHNGATFTAPDRILGNIVGSMYTHSYFEKPDRRGVTFMRHRNTGKQHYKDPDRR